MTGSELVNDSPATGTVKVRENSLVKQCTNKRIEPQTSQSHFTVHTHRYTCHNNFVVSLYHKHRKLQETLSQSPGIRFSLHKNVPVSVSQECALWTMTFVLQPHYTGSALHHITKYFNFFSYFAVDEISKQLNFSQWRIQAWTCEHAFKFNCLWLESVRDGAITELFSCPSLVWLVSA